MGDCAASIKFPKAAGASIKSTARGAPPVTRDPAGGGYQSALCLSGPAARAHASRMR